MVLKVEATKIFRNIMATKASSNASERVDGIGKDLQVHTGNEAFKTAFTTTQAEAGRRTALLFYQRHSRVPT